MYSKLSTMAVLAGGGYLLGSAAAEVDFPKGRAVTSGNVTRFSESPSPVDTLTIKDVSESDESVFFTLEFTTNANAAPHAKRMAISWRVRDVFEQDYVPDVPEVFNISARVSNARVNGSFPLGLGDGYYFLDALGAYRLDPSSEREQGPDRWAARARTYFRIENRGLTIMTPAAWLSESNIHEGRLSTEDDLLESSEIEVDIDNSRGMQQ